MKVYVLTKGEYSDYHIVGVTLDKDTARQYADWFNNGNPYDVEWGYGIEVEEFDTDCIDEWHGKKWFDVDGLLGGRLAAKPADISYEPDEWHIYTDIMTKKRHFSTRVCAKDEAHAVKIGAERMAKVLYERAERGEE